ncbi:CPCC family cysteine-rich protein [Nocardiopsis suaedae]|uniref:CPCC family cysteine-rich protein n=1 Tax=Nocardiopsis suaedae TaxID=3018444 RepID=UPI0038CDB41A
MGRWLAVVHDCGEKSGSALYPCPCCGYLVHEEPPGCHQICSVCYWEDDEQMLRWPLMAGGANKVSLVDAQRSFAEVGASEERFVSRADGLEGLERESGFRYIDLTKDCFEPTHVQERPWPDDLTVLYWWRPTFWKRGMSSAKGKGGGGS